MGPDRVGDGRGVVGEAEQDAGAAADQPAQPQVPKAGRGGGGVLVPGLPVDVDQGGVEPGEVAAEPGAPHDTADLLGPQVQRHRRVQVDRGIMVVGLGGRGVEAAAADDLVDHRPGPGGEGVCGGHVGSDAVVEGDPVRRPP